MQSESIVTDDAAESPTVSSEDELTDELNMSEEPEEEEEDEETRDVFVNDGSVAPHVTMRLTVEFAETRVERAYTQETLMDEFSAYLNLILDGQDPQALNALLGFDFI